MLMLKCTTIADTSVQSDRNSGKKEAMFDLEHAMKAQKGSIALLFL
jgi:hypothetical protein